jgi:hypothetical protein
LRLVVSVESPSGRRVVSLPDDSLVSNLLPALVQECEGADDAAGWSLAAQGEPALEAGQTLAEAGLFSGAVLVLAAPPPLVQMPASPRPPPIESMGAAEYSRLLDAAIVSRESRPSTVVAVVATHPGAGATTVAALLATALSALRDDRVVAVDANPESGALSHWLVPDGSLPGATYRSLFTPEVAPAEVGAALVAATPRLSVLPAPLDPSGARAGDGSGWGRLIEHLRHLHHIVVIDCGTRRGVVNLADQVVLVSRYGPPVATRPIQKPVVSVANQAPRRRRINGLEITLAAEPRAAARLKRRGFAWSDAPPAWQEAVRELAAMLVAGA